VATINNSFLHPTFFFAVLFDEELSFVAQDKSLEFIVITDMGILTGW